MTTIKLLEEVFKLSGIPDLTYVEPDEYVDLLVAIRTPGRCVVVEGPSGIGKTTAVIVVLRSLGVNNPAFFSARKRDDLPYIEGVIGDRNAGIVVIDDFHRLSSEVRHRLSDFMKVLADEEERNTKLILIGINKSGDTLVQFSADLNTRISTIRMGTSRREKTLELIRKGEEALNVSIADRYRIADSANGSFLITQLLCHDTCTHARVLQTAPKKQEIDPRFEIIQGRVMLEMDRKFFPSARNFAQGSKLRREGRAPYLHLLKWLSESAQWTISLEEEGRRHRELHGSIVQVKEKKHIDKLFEDKPDLQNFLHYESSTGTLSTEDPIPVNVGLKCRRDARSPASIARGSARALVDLRSGARCARSPRSPRSSNRFSTAMRRGRRSPSRSA